MIARRFLGKFHWAEWEQGVIRLYLEIPGIPRTQVSYEKVLYERELFNELQAFIYHMHLLLNYTAGSTN